MIGSKGALKQRKQQYQLRLVSSFFIDFWTIGFIGEDPKAHKTLPTSQAEDRTLLL